MTRRQRLEAVINGKITEELIEDCKRELAKLDVVSAKALEKARSTDHYNENKALEEKIVEVLTDEPIQVEDLMKKLGVELTRQRLTAICTNLVREGRIKIVDIKVKGKGKRRAYHV